MIRVNSLSKRIYHDSLSLNLLINYDWGIKRSNLCNFNHEINLQQ